MSMDNTVPDDEEREKVTECIAKQAQGIHLSGKHRSRWNTHFYKVVLGGNVSAVRQVVVYMTEHDMGETLNWLLMRREVQPLDERTPNPCACPLLCLCLKRCVMFLGLAVVGLILSPVFYMLHILSTTLLNRTQRRISAKSNLPLALAVFGQSRDMIQYFVSIGVDIENVDANGNNVFHHIADLSATSSTKAISMVETSIEVFAESVPMQVIKRMIVDDRNSAGLTVLEYTTKYGSLAFLTKLLKLPNILQESEIAVEKNAVSLARNGASLLPDAETRMELVDVTKYEAGSLADQSTLLNLLSDTDIVNMTSEDLQLFSKASFIVDWIHLKLKQMFLGVMFFHTVDVAITLLVLFLFSKETFVPTFRVWFDQNSLSVRLHELEALSQNTSHIFKHDRFQQLLDEVQYRKQVEYLGEMNEVMDTLMVAARIRSSRVDRYFSDAGTGWDVHDNTTNVPRWVIDELYDTAMTLESLTKHWLSFYIVKNFTHYVVEYARQLSVRYPDLLKASISVNNRQHIRETAISFYYDGFTFGGDINASWTNMAKTQDPPIAYEDIEFYLCVPSHLFNTSDLLPFDIPMPPKHLYRTACDLKFLLDVASASCVVDSVSTDNLYTRFHAKQELNTSSKLASGYPIILALFVCAVVYLLLDMVERTVFIYTCVVHQTTARAMLITACSKKVPGSYARKQMNICTYLGIVFFFVLAFMVETLNNRGMTFDEVEHLQHFILILVLVLRFVMHIHAMRLFPGIGHFVISTFMMGTNLLHFSAIFGIVVLIFSGIFHMIADRAACPVLKEEGFDTITASLLSTFQLAFGHGELGVYSTTTALSVSYVLYVVIMGLLLMNLIIAVMTSTATQILVEPWKGALWLMEWLDEATSVEYTSRVLALPWRCCCIDTYGGHGNAGFVVKRVEGVWKIYINIFHCSAVE